MKTRYLLVTFILGLALALVLLWSLEGWSTPVAAQAPIAAPHAPAAELHVCPSGCTHSSVQAAVDAANEGDIIKVAAGTYTGVSARNSVTQVAYISKAVTIRGGYTAHSR